MAESLLLPLVRGVAGKATDTLVEMVTRMCGLDEDRRTLGRHLLAVECKLANAEERCEKNDYVKSWMKDLKSVTYEANDVLDDFQYEALRRQSKIGMSTFRKVRGYITHRSPLLFRFEMTKKLKNVLEKINKLVEEMNKFGLENSVHREEWQHPWRQTHSKLDDSTKIFGRDNNKEEVVKLLLDQQDQRMVHVLPIFGMGGLGKTTLAKMAYNDQEVQKHFQLKMWHCVSDNFDAINLLKSIIELAANKRCDMSDTIEPLQNQLEEVIGQKRFMLVLDDVWNEDERKWVDVLKPLLCSVGGPGSVIVVTTRSQKVASIMQTLQPHKLACLNEEDSWELFSNKAFSNCVQEQAELVTIGKCIANKCGGLPLALKTMGGLVSSKQEIHEWKAIEESNIGDNDGGKYEVMPVLKLSYKHLSSEMKQCFAFCAVFPKDYEMQKDMLIQLWMANGFIQEGTMDLTLKGEFIFDELIWRSFLQDKKVVVKSEGKTKYETVVCKMHDLMHDVAKDVTYECASIEDPTEQKVLLKDVFHMQMRDAGLKRITGLRKGRTYLRTLLDPSKSSVEYYVVNGTEEDISINTSHKDFRKLLQVSASLRALHCPPSSVGTCKAINAKHLRYLDLSGSCFIRLPDSICVLYNLQTLKLIGCWKLRQLPEDMTRLRKLIHLYLSGCVRLKRMPPNFGVLKNLHILTIFVVGTGNGRGIEQLKDMRHLSNRLELLNLSKIKSGENAKEANLNQKKNLSELLFSWDQEIDDETEEVEEVLQCLEPHSNIQKLEIYGYDGLEISQWMKRPQMFNYLRELKISDCPRCKSIPVVWLSVSLEILSLQEMDSLTTLCNNLGVEAGGCITPLQIFPGLKRMELIELPSLEKWVENSVGEPSDSLVTFPMLEELRIKDCPKLASIPVTPIVSQLTIVGVHSTTVSLVFMSIHLGSWPYLVSLTLGSPEEITMLPLDAQQSQSQRCLEKLESLTLEGPNSLVRSSGLSRSHLMAWKCFQFVESLTICTCSDLVRWPTEELQCLDRLRFLCIRNCDNLKGNTSLSVEESHLPSLEELYIAECHGVVALPWNLGNLARLTSFSVIGCSDLKTLPDGMCGLTSLTIWSCPAIREFPRCIVERLSTLKCLIIIDCPKLRRPFRKGGEYFHLVSSLGDKFLCLP
ncbi:hypothetical protein VPH35_070297 [Triticum aestivum]